MLNAGTPAYYAVLHRACRYLNLDVQRFLAPGVYVRLPAVLTTLPVHAWITDAWFTGDTDAISRATFDRVGPRPVVVPMSVREAGLPTRSLFLTLDRPLAYEGVRFPCGIPPLLFYSALCDQRAVHCHVVMVFHYYARSPYAMCAAMHINPITALPIKTSVAKTLQYIKAQEIRPVSYVCNRPEVLAYKNPRRCLRIATAVANEMTTCGPPFAIDGVTARSVSWRWHGVARVFVTRADLALLLPLLPRVELYVSGRDGWVDCDYLGQALIAVRPVRLGMRAPTVTLPLCATFVLMVQ
jgi:hypothetical protein